MEFLNYLANNIPLFSISAVMIFLAFRNLKIRRKESIYFLSFTTIVLFLSVIVFFEKYSQAHGLLVVGTIATSLGYIFRPILLFLFVLLANMEEKRDRKFYTLASIPLLVNFIIYLFPLMIGVPGVSTFIFSYQMNSDGTASFVRGGFLNFTSHAICLLYLVLLIYVSTVRFHGKHRRDGLVLILCVAIIVVTVAAEMIFDRNDLLNIVCEICAMINYIFIMTVNSSRDPLTNLYDRRTYLEDVSRYKTLVNGLIMIDMNELKFVNDNYGHQTGDEALHELAQIFDSSVEPSIMCTYRVSGDEFIILMFQGKIEQLDNTVSRIRKRVEECKYSAAIGTCYINKKAGDISFEEAYQKAEELMYQDKSKYYVESGHDRRRS